MSTTAIQKKKIWTYDDYLTLPDDLNIYEIIEGELFMTPAPTTKHQKVSRNLFRLLDRHLTEHPDGEAFYSPIDVVLSRHTVVQPDIIFISKDNLSIITEKNIKGTPDLVIEILSPTTGQKDRIVKMNTYAKHGIRNIWLIDPDNRTLEVFELDRKKTYRLILGLAGEAEFKPSLFPGLTIPLKEAWK